MKKKAFDRFTRKAARLFANDADISTEELVGLVTAAACATEGADDEDINDDPAMDEEDDDRDGADDADPEDDEGADDEEPEGETAEEKAKRKKAADAARRRRAAMDADAIRATVIRDISDWNTAVAAVEPHIGAVRVAMDAMPGGARGLYRKALDHAKVSHKGIKELPALAAMVSMLPDPVATNRLAMDAAPLAAGEVSPLDSVLPPLNIARS